MQPKNRTLAGHLGRALVVFMSFALAVLVALTVLLIIGSYSMGEELRDGYEATDEMGVIVNILSMLFGGASFLMVVTPILSIIPALLAAIIAEVVQIRALLYYLVAGGLAVTALPIIASPAQTSFDASNLAIFATAGFAGGLVYWLLAGRNA